MTRDVSLDGLLSMLAHSHDPDTIVDQLVARRLRDAVTRPLTRDAYDDYHAQIAREARLGRHTGRPYPLPTVDSDGTGRSYRRVTAEDVAHWPEAESGSQEYEGQR